jgi:hypothetical protein
MFVDLKDVVGLRFSNNDKSEIPPRNISLAELTQPGWAGPVLKVCGKTDENSLSKFAVNELDKVRNFVNAFAELAASVQMGSLKVPLRIEFILHD